MTKSANSYGQLARFYDVVYGGREEDRRRSNDMRTNPKWLVAVMVVGFLSAGAIHGQMQFNPSFQQALYNPLVGGLAILIVLCPVGAWGTLGSTRRAVL